MPENPIEYAKQPNGTFILNDLNGPARYKCNNTIGTNDISITDAKKTYEKLYEIYNTNDKNVKVTSNMFQDSDPDHCMIGNGKNENGVTANKSAMACPHNRTSDNNLLAYTGNVDTNQQVQVKDLKFYLDDCGARIRDYDNNSSNTTKSYTQAKNDATQFRDGSYNTLVSTRRDLDNKMNEILGNNKNSILYEKQGELDATVYSTLLWTVMVTSLLYYVFTKI